MEDIDANLNYYSEVFPDVDVEGQSEYYSADEFSSDLHVYPNDISILSFNIRSLYPKLEDVDVLLNELKHHFSFICISETWLNQSTVELTRIGSFKPLQ